MAKSRKKARKELDRLLRSEKHWQWLRLVEQEDLAGQYREQMDQAWRSVIRRALRRPSGFEEFCQEARRLKKPPVGRDRSLLADYAFLLDLDVFLQSGKTPAHLTLTKDLSPAARALRERISALEGTSFSEAKLEKLLKPFIETPRKVTRRHYGQLAKSLAGTSVDRPVRELGEHLATLRSLTGKSASRQIQQPPFWEQMEDLDMFCAALSERLPATLFQVLVHPLACQLADFIGALPPAGFIQRVTRALSALPFLFPLASGDRHPTVARELTLAGAHRSLPSSVMQLEEQLPQASFEEQVRLLGALRLAVKRPDQEERPTPFLDFFAGPEQPPQQKALRAVYEKVLAGIEARLPAIGPRDRRELTRVMDAFLAEDIPYLLDEPADHGQMAQVLERFMRAGCLGRRLSLLALMTTRRSRSLALERAAHELLNSSGPLEEAELRWALEEFRPLYLPYLRAIGPLLDYLPGEQSVWDGLFFQLATAIEHFLLAGAAIQRSPWSVDFGPKTADWDQADRDLLRRDTQELARHSQLEPLTGLLTCFPQGYTHEGFLCWLKHLRATGRHHPYLAAKSKHLAAHLEHPDLRLGMGSVLAQLAWEQMNILCAFLLEQLEDIRQMDSEAVGRLLRPLLPHAARVPQGRSLLLKIYRLLEERAGRGDETADRLVEPVLELLMLMGRTPSRKPRRRRTRS